MIGRFTRDGCLHDRQKGLAPSAGSPGNYPVPHLGKTRGEGALLESGEPRALRGARESELIGAVGLAILALPTGGATSNVLGH